MPHIDKLTYQSRIETRKQLMDPVILPVMLPGANSMCLALAGSIPLR